MNKFLSALMVASLFSFPSFAKSVASAPNQCMKETINVSVNYSNLKGKDFADVKKLIDDQNAKINEYAKQQKIEKLNIQNQNYYINSSATSYDPSGAPTAFQFQGSGSVSYTFDNLDVAMKFCEFLSSIKIQVSLSSSSYNQGNCGDANMIRE